MKRQSDFLHATERRATGRAGLNTRRRGSVIVVAAVCLLVVGALLASAIKLATTSRRQVRHEQFRVQAAWLAQAGLDRAADRLAANADYPGETWNIAADQFDGVHTAGVVIAIESIESDKTVRQVKVQATYPANARLSARHTLTTRISSDE